MAALQEQFDSFKAQAKADLEIAKTSSSTVTKEQEAKLQEAMAATAVELERAEKAEKALATVKSELESLASAAMKDKEARAAAEKEVADLRNQLLVSADQCCEKDQVHN